LINVDVYKRSKQAEYTNMSISFISLRFSASDFAFLTIIVFIKNTHLNLSHALSKNIITLLHK
jgi:hypothetical protein